MRLERNIDGKKKRGNTEESTEVRESITETEPVASLVCLVSVRNSSVFYRSPSYVQRQMVYVLATKWQTLV